MNLKKSCCHPSRGRENPGDPLGLEVLNMLVVQVHLPVGLGLSILGGDGVLGVSGPELVHSVEIHLIVK
jgi:hypothetical protein